MTIGGVRELLPTDVVKYHVGRESFRRGEPNGPGPFMALVTDYLGFDQFRHGVVWVPYGHEWIVSFNCRKDAERFVLLATNDRVVMSVNGALVV